jgi:hypothetical protein
MLCHHLMKSLCQYLIQIVLYRIRVQAYYKSSIIHLQNSLLSHMCQLLSISLLVFKTV